MEKACGKESSVSMNEVSSRYSKPAHQADSGISIINLLIGIWLIISPFVVMAFNQFMNMTPNNVIVGILVGLFALFRVSSTARPQWSWANVVLGIWLIISPFALGASSNATVVWHNVIAGIVVALLAWANAFRTHSSVTTAHPMP